MGPFSRHFQAGDGADCDATLGSSPRKKRIGQFHGIARDSELSPYFSFQRCLLLPEWLAEWLGPAALCVFSTTPIAKGAGARS